jgi:hypothetical protein
MVVLVELADKVQKQEAHARRHREYLRNGKVR